MKGAIDLSPSRRQVLRLATMVTACALVAKAPRAAEPLKGENSNAYVPDDGVSIFESVWQTVRDRFYDPCHNGLDWSAVGRDIFQTFSEQLPRTLWRASLIPCCLS
ncbi:hypothetical protein IVB01_10655 [Bradyrhizobium sp. 164]|nr:hypothetical protein [Bradyrhizobium sp. 164]